MAWVPDDDPGRDWGLAAQLAVDWIEERRRQERSQGILVTNTLGHLGVPELERFEKKYQRVSPRSSRRDSRGPVLSYVPTLKDLEFATGLARKSSLAVVESFSTPLRGWAAWLEALNLVTGAPTAVLPETTREAVERLKFCGNNGFADDYGKRDALRIISGLHERGCLDQDLLVGAVFAAGVFAVPGIKNLASLIERVERRAPGPANSRDLS